MTKEYEKSIHPVMLMRLLEGVIASLSSDKMRIVGFEGKIVEKVIDANGKIIDAFEIRLYDNAGNCWAKRIDLEP